jgi:hypothetical protein
MDILPTDFSALVLTISGDTVAWLLDAPKLLDVDMEEFSSVLAIRA